MWASKTETATRVRGRIESILDWAEHRDYRSGKNPAAWKGNLEFELPSPTKLKKRKKRHHPALPYLRVGAFMADLRSRQGVSIRALEWGILTATRSQEIRGTRHSEINLDPEGTRRWIEIQQRAQSAGLAPRTQTNEVTLEAIAATRVPILLVAGEHDRLLTPEMLQVIAARLPNAEPI